MLRTLILKELRVIVTGPKFVATFAACSLLLLLSVYIGIEEYNQAVDQHHMSEQLVDERLQQVSSWHRVQTREQRKPDPMQIFSSGLHYDIGRWTPIESEQSVKLKNSMYSDDPIFAVFRILDFTLIVQVVFSLFALLFTFDAVNGEKESGTLRLIFANAVPRARYIMAKALGSWLGLVVPLLIPILISLLMVQVFRVPLTGEQWLRVGAIVGVSLVYISLFVMLGVLMSTLTRRSSVSFLLSLVLWIGFVLIIPRAGVMAAGHISPVPRLAQIEGLRDGYAKDKWEVYYAEAEDRFQENRRLDEEDEFDEAKMWERMEKEDSIRSEVQKEIEAYESRLMEDLENRRREQQRVGFALSRVSPAAAYQLAAMTLAGTELALKSRYEDALSEHRAEFLNYVEEKSASAGPGAGAVMIEMDSEKGLTIKSGRDNAGVDVSDRPRFTAPLINMSSAIQSVLVDAGLLLLLTILSFAATIASFLRFDVR
jgi:ABC-type transport system involved in multi-copper enzyme maturation permease subunit